MRRLATDVDASDQAHTSTLEEKLAPIILRRINERTADHAI